MNYQLELRNYLNKIYNEKIYQILVKEDLSQLKNMNLNEIKSLISSKDVYLGSDFNEYIINLIPEGFDEYLLRKSISQNHNINHPLLYNENGDALKDYTHNTFTTLLWKDFTNKTFINDLNNKFSHKDFSNYLDKNLDSIYPSLISKIELFKSKNAITIDFTDNDLVNTVKKMILANELDRSYAFSFVNMDKLRSEMENLFIDTSFYDEFDKLDDDLEECLDKFFKYDNKELLDILVNKENFTLVDDNKLIKNF